MNDRFLNRFRKQPRPEFQRELYQRLQQQDGHKPLRSRRIAQGFVALTLVLMMTVMVMPGVLARPLGITLHTESGLTFLEVDRLPKSASPGLSNPRIRLATVNSLKEAQRIAGFQFDVPAWIPAGFVQLRPVNMVGLQDTRDVDRTAVPGSEIYLQPYGVSITWRDTRSPRRITLWVVKPGYWFDRLPSLTVGRGSFTLVDLGSATGGLVEGQWNAQTRRWDPTRGGYLAWKNTSVTYYLVTSGGHQDGDDLTRMALSTH